MRRTVTTAGYQLFAVAGGSWLQVGAYWLCLEALAAMHSGHGCTKARRDMDRGSCE
jgi:hypothetical protein